MHPALQHLTSLFKPNPGWYALFAALLLTGMGVAAIGTVAPDFASKQLKFWLPIALCVMAGCMVPPPRAIGMLSYGMLITGLVVLILLLMPGTPRAIVPVVNGARSWINLPQGIRFQPSEVVKIFFVLAIAWYLRYSGNHRTLRGLLPPFLIMFVPVLLILKQPDLGTALLFAPTLFAMLVAAGAKLRHLFSLVGLGVGAIVIVVVITLVAPPSMQVLKEHQRTRIESMFYLAQGDTRFVQSSGYQLDKAMTLIGAGGMTGYGGERSADIVGYNKLPHDHNDMIFAVVVNRWGLLGALAILALYGVLVCSVLLVAARTKDPFARLACVGFAAMIFTQAVINIAMHLNLMPITGITLPFMSYGGSSLLAVFAMVGLILNFASRRAVMLARPSFEFDNHADAIFQ